MDRTNAERQRRYIARLKARAAPDGHVQELEAEVARLRARIQQLESSLGISARRHGP